MAKRNKQQVIAAMPIVGIGAKGKAVGKKDGMVYFVAGAVPGDVCTVQTLKKKRGFYEAKSIEITTPSADRVEPVCQHFGTCGGCKWQNLSYTAQLAHKAESVAQNFQKIAHIVPKETLPILGSRDIYFYRNKLEFTFTNQRWLTNEEIASDNQNLNRNGVGFHIPGFWDKVLHLNKCYLQAEPTNAIRQFCFDFAIKNNLSFFDIRQKKGLLRNLMIRTTTKGQVMVLMQFGEADQPSIQKILDALVDTFPEITSLQYVVNTKQNDTIYDLEVICYRGTPFIIEQMPAIFEGNIPLEFIIGPKSFYQTNPNQAFELYKTALNFAELSGGETVYDLYTGTGTIALFLAQKARKVVGIEAVKEAIDDAKLNAERNKISNAEFVVGDMKDAFSDAFIEAHGQPDVIVTDPPRDGMHPKVVQQLLKLSAQKLVYVSCNPATQARDLALLSEKYNVAKSRAVDMFPQTHHIENVVLLELK